MLESYTFKGKNKGKNLLVLGAIHGNEICGPKAINTIIKKIQNNEIVINSGSVTFIPVCNPKAHSANKRYIDINLNRIIKKHKNPEGYEEEIASEISEYIENADYLLDIHSIHTEGVPFAFQDYSDQKHKKFVSAQKFGYVLTGWPNLPWRNRSDKTDGTDGTTCGYAYIVDTISTTIECGCHNNPSCIKRAENSIINSLNCLDITKKDEKTLLSNNNGKPTVFVNMKDIIYKEKEGDFIKDWEHLDKIKKGTVIAEYSDGTKVISENDMFMVIPYKEAKVGDEWFYIGEEV